MRLFRLSSTTLTGLLLVLFYRPCCQNSLRETVIINCYPSLSMCLWPPEAIPVAPMLSAIGADHVDGTPGAEDCFILATAQPSITFLALGVKSACCHTLVMIKVPTEYFLFIFY